MANTNNTAESIRQFIKKGKYDQNGEHFLLMEIIKRIKLKKADCVEFGAPDKTYCSNIAELPNSFVKRYYDIDPNEPGITKATITKDNVNEIIGDCDILSIDIDGLDYSVWKAYTFTPAVVIIEINSSIPPDRIQPINSPTDGTAYLPMKILGESKGYFLLCHTGNLVFVLNKYKELFGDADPSFDKSWL